MADFGLGKTYRLAESVFFVESEIDWIQDERLSKDCGYLGDPVTTVKQGVRGDAGDGLLELEQSERGDSTAKITWTGDGRISSLSYNSVGVGSKVVGAGAKLLATIAGTALRAAPVPAAPVLGLLGLRGLAARVAPNQQGCPPVEAAVRRAWEADHEDAKEHKAAYEQIAASATSKLTELRKSVVEKGPDEAPYGEIARIRQIEAVLDSALKEIAKVEAMFTAWSEARLTRIPRKVSFAIGVDEVPVHKDRTDERPARNPLEVSEKDDPALFSLWNVCGLWIEVGPTFSHAGWRPNPVGTQAAGDRVYWRLPQPASLWVWRRDSEGAAVLDQVVDTMVVDRFSDTGSLPIEGRYFGEAAVDVTFDELGFPATTSQSDKSAAGAVADGLAGLPGQIQEGLSAVGTIATTTSELRDAAAKRRLAEVTRKVDQRSKELELQGINATADSYAELKRLQQQVEIAEAQSTLAPPSPTELSRLENDLAEATARRDLEAVNRARAQESELAATQAEIARLQAQIDLLTLQRKV